MRAPLQKFTAFASQLLPHETSYLLSIERFADDDRRSILSQVDYNSRMIGDPEPFDVQIDKRKYSHLQHWIENALQAIDVDMHFEWLNTMEQKIVTDSIGFDDEKVLLQKIRNYKHPVFYFRKFYELIDDYRQFLLIRIRYAEYELVNEFIEKYAEDFNRSKNTSDTMHDASRDIVGQYSGTRSESLQWEKWLSEIFFDETLDGLNRYHALVRLIFISFNYARFEILEDKFQYLDQELSEGHFYSKRLLLNYYNNRLLFHSHFREYEKAVYYGYLSVRVKNHDYIHYVNNLAAVLMRLDRNKEALDLMKKASVDLKVTANMHSKVGFAAFYMESMNKNKLYKHAENYGDSFLQAYAREILQYRWHLFFTVYFLALLHRNKFDKILE
ncbi:MAG: hypothetical protein KDC53_15160, partial [Saprospiraceae bacterium]|nr:hypothetical protein [Saprospiraceae bacterium]